MKSKPFLFAALMLFLLCGGALALTAGGSNLDITGYPGFDGVRPSVPAAIEIQDAEAYRLEMEAYLEEIREYIKNARYDMERISEEINKAKAEADDAVAEYNDFVETASKR